LLEVLRLLMKNRTRNYRWNFEMVCINNKTYFQAEAKYIHIYLAVNSKILPLSGYRPCETQKIS